MRTCAVVGVGLACLAGVVGPSGAADVAASHPPVCARPTEEGVFVPEARDLRSKNGVLNVDLAIRDDRQPDGSVRYCYVTPDGAESPTLRVKPGDELVLRLKNELVEWPASAAGSGIPGIVGVLASDANVCRARPRREAGACTSGAMTALSTNLHFHGMTVAPTCHGDDVLDTAIEPTDGAFEYHIRIPEDEAPGLYWYHPHIHGYSSRQVQGGASGALIVEGIERANPELAGMAERVLVVRDQDPLHPNALPSAQSGAAVILDHDGDAVNAGTGDGQPAKDLSVNFVTVSYPDYRPATVAIRPNERQLWRLLNASAVTYLDLSAVFKRGPRYRPQWLGVVAVDGVPLTVSGAHGHAIEWRDSVVVPPGARVEFIMVGPPEGVPGMLVTHWVDTGAAGENDPNRPLLNIVSSSDAAQPASILPKDPQPLPPSTQAWLGDVTPTRVRHLYFSEDAPDPKNPSAPVNFYITPEGQQARLFDMSTAKPEIVVHQGDVEDWVIENRTPELHAFHIHQLHFQLVDWSGLPINEPYLRDTVNVPFFNGREAHYPSVRLRMDFRGANTVGTFLYHCHLLDHEDAGMMGEIQVLPRAESARRMAPDTLKVADSSEAPRS